MIHFPLIACPYQPQNAPWFQHSTTLHSIQNLLVSSRIYGLLKLFEQKDECDKGQDGDEASHDVRPIEDFIAPVVLPSRPRKNTQ